MEITPLEPTIVFQDEDILVINKPSGLTVNKSDTTIHEMTVQDWVENLQSSLRGAIATRQSREDQARITTDGIASPRSDGVRNDGEGNESDFYKRAGIVHRLDKETSGILLIAKTPDMFVNLQRQFKERAVEKTYTALVHGNLIPSEGEINVPVGRLEYNRKRFGIVAGGREASTLYRVISNFKLLISNEQLSLVELQPKTGRTHQIRVHLKYLNHPIFSDTLYAGRKTARNDRKLLSRLFLHASKISFLHPLTGERVRIESLLPEELQGFLDTLSQ